MNTPSLTKNDYRKFGLVMALFIALIFGLFLPWVLKIKVMPLWPWIVSSVFVLWSLVFPAGLKIVHKPWMQIGKILGIINTTIILGVIFFLVFTPVALFFKLVGKDFMDRKLNKAKTVSYWKTSTKQSKEHMENLY